MNQSNHTPGPWSADKWATGYTVSAPDGHYSVCHLEDCNNAEANARLIAAAPELLSACEGLFEVIEARVRGAEISGWREKLWLGRDAITKAKGGAA